MVSMPLIFLPPEQQVGAGCIAATYEELRAAIMVRSGESDDVYGVRFGYHPNLCFVLLGGGLWSCGANRDLL